MLRRGGLYRAVNALLQREEDERLWQLYLACAANPLGTPGSFEDFRGQYGSRATPEVRSMCREEMDREIRRARESLRLFRTEASRRTI